MPLPDEPLKAGRIIAAAQCYLKDRRAARQTYAALDQSGQQFVRYVCRRNDIRL